MPLRPFFLGRRQAEIDIGLAARRQGAAGFEGVEARSHECALAMELRKLDLVSF